MYFCAVFRKLLTRTYVYCIVRGHGHIRAHTDTYTHTETHTHTHAHTQLHTLARSHTHRLALLVSSDGRIAAVSCLSSQLNSRSMALPSGSSKARLCHAPVGVAVPPEGVSVEPLRCAAVCWLHFLLFLVADMALG